MKKTAHDYMNDDYRGLLIFAIGVAVTAVASQQAGAAFNSI